LCAFVKRTEKVADSGEKLSFARDSCVDAMVQVTMALKAAMKVVAYHQLFQEFGAYGGG
jgi:hypothetical protein